MNKETKEKIHSFNRNRWELGAKRWAECADSRGLWQRCPTEPSLVLCETELKYLENIAGKEVCVLGSGDNQVVFALAGLGAKVTSVDISQNQLDYAAKRADSLGLSINFVQADVTDLQSLSDSSFDTVYTGGHVAVWVADLEKYYSEAARILNNNGLFIVNEYHPFRRIWKPSKDRLIIEFPYQDQGPFEYLLDEDILYPQNGDVKTFEFHWTVSDYLNAVIKAGFDIILVDEYGDYVGDWEGSPMHGLPENLLIIAGKVVEKVNSEKPKLL